MPHDIVDYDPETDLVLTRDLSAPRHLIWRCWTDPAHLPHWFIPRPHRVTACTIDLRVGGAFDTTFDVDGNVMDNRGVWLEVVPEERLVFTDASTTGWKPAPEPFMTAIVSFADLGGGRTRYVAVARHRSAETRKTHEEMGFHDGWGTVAGQLDAYAQGLM
jgi:uncharacterized protein YndB with AHSA1/START domain